MGRIRIANKEIHIGVLEEIYTGPNLIRSGDMLRNLAHRFPNVDSGLLKWVWRYEREKLINDGGLRKDAPRFFTVAKRAVVGVHLDGLMNGKAKKRVAKIQPVPIVAPTSIKDRVILAMAQKIKQLRQEVAELLDERSLHNQVVTEANLQVKLAGDAIINCSKLPEGVDLDELGIVVD